MRNKFLRVLLVLALAFMYLFMLAAGVVSCTKSGSVTSQSLDPVPASVIDVNEIVWYDAGVAVSTTTYYYGPADNGTTGEVILRWNQAELFATIDIVTGTQVMTVTPQMSADGTNWVDAWFTNPDAWSSSETGSVTTVGVSGTLTTTVASSGSGASATSTVDRNLAFSADGTDALSFPLIGKYMRLKTEVLTTAYTVIPEFYVILKNK